MMDMYLKGSLYLNAEKVDEKAYIVHLSNGRSILVMEDVQHNGSQWPWMVGTQFFSKDEYALNYLKRLVAEMLTGKRVIFHAKRNVPEICGVDGAACRAKGMCNTALCIDCPVAEKFFAERDGVELIYAV